MAFPRDERYAKPVRRALRAKLARPLRPGGPRNPGEIIEEARAALKRLRAAGMPEFLRERLQRMEEILRMLSDRGFDLPIDPRLQAIVALRYFAAAKDPALRNELDDVDDARVIDLVNQQLAHQLVAYREFCAFRRESAAARGFDARRFTRRQWLVERRKALEEQLRERGRHEAFAPAEPSAERFQVV